MSSYQTVNHIDRGGFGSDVITRILDVPFALFLKQNHNYWGGNWDWLESDGTRILTIFTINQIQQLQFYTHTNINKHLIFKLCAKWQFHHFEIFSIIVLADYPVINKRDVFGVDSYFIFFVLYLQNIKTIHNEIFLI